MKKIIGIGLVALGVAFSGSSAIAADGAAIFKAKCAACHGATGQGTAMAPAFNGNDWVQNNSDDAIAHVITEGRQGADKRYKKFPIAMPKQPLSDAEVTAVVEHIKSLAAK